MQFNVGDRIEKRRVFARDVRAEILTLRYVNATNIAKVLREDNGQEDVWIWNDFQTGISVFKIEN